VATHFEEAYASLADSERMISEALADLERRLDQAVEKAEPDLSTSFTWLYAFLALSVVAGVYILRIRSTVHRLDQRLLVHSPRKR
jgi:hypothetical protein